MREKRWRNSFADDIWREVSPEEAKGRLAKLYEQNIITPVQIEGSKERWIVLEKDLPLLEMLAEGKTPSEWQPLGPSTQDEVTFFAPLEIVSARGRAKQVFGFEYIWEVYKPVEQRRWGYYVLPILYGDDLVARLDPKLDRKTMTLQHQRLLAGRRCASGRSRLCGRTRQRTGAFCEFCRSKTGGYRGDYPQEVTEPHTEISGVLGGDNRYMSLQRVTNPIHETRWQNKTRARNWRGASPASAAG
jgi:uncharacterized protein YcaQ